MNTSLFRRSALLALLVAASLSACKKENDPAPAADLADRLSGQYTLAQVTVNGKSYSASEAGLKGGGSVTRQSASTVSMMLNINDSSTGEGFLNGSVDDITLTDAGNGEVDLSKDGDKIGRGNQHKLTLNGKDDKNVPFTFTMTK